MPGLDERFLVCVQGEGLAVAAPWGEARSELATPVAMDSIAGAGPALVGLGAGRLWRYRGEWELLGPAPEEVAPPGLLQSLPLRAVLYLPQGALVISANGEPSELEGAAVGRLGPRFRAAEEPSFPDQGNDPLLGRPLMLDEPSPWGGRLVVPEATMRQGQPDGPLVWLDGAGRPQDLDGLQGLSPWGLRGYGPGDMLLIDGRVADPPGPVAVLAHPSGVVEVAGATGACTWWWGPPT